MTNCSRPGGQSRLKAGKEEGRATDLNRRKKVEPGELWKGSVTVLARLQSVVLQILTDLSSDYEEGETRISRRDSKDADIREERTWVARYSPTGSQQTPLTKPSCSPILVIMSKKWMSRESALALGEKERGED